MAEIQYANCPKCSSSNIKKVGYTWWGGIIGPALLTHVKCQDCRTTFNGKTGKSNRNAIIIYSFIIYPIGFGVIAFVIFLLISVRR